MKTEPDQGIHVSQSGRLGEGNILAWSICVTLNRTAFL